MSCVITASNDAVGTPAPVIDVREIMAVHLSLTGLLWLWNWNGNLDGGSVIGSSLILNIFRLRQSHICLRQHIRILNTIPAFGAIGAVRVVMSGS